MCSIARATLPMVSVAVATILVDIASCTVQLPGWFSDDMVLQTSDGEGPQSFLAGRTVPTGEQVTITGGVGNYTVISDAASGYWKVGLAHSSTWHAGSGGMQITVQGETGPAVVAKGVLAGDVFFCAGQSNMLFTLHQALNYTAEAATVTNYPNFRFFMTNRALNNTPQFDLTTNDANCDAAAPPQPPAPPPAPPPRPDNTCLPSTFLNDTFYGHGHGPSIGSASGKDGPDCCAQCSSATWRGKGCQYFSFEPAASIGSLKGAAGATGKAVAGGTCWFKTSEHGPPRTLNGAVSGATGAAPLPPGPPKPCNTWITAAEAAANDAAYLQSFSAVCFMTIRNIARMHTHDRPMGLVQAAWGGSRIEGWMSSRALNTAAAPFAGNVPPVNTPIPSPNAANANVESSLYNGMVSPWSNFSIKAALWYQGEENADQSCQANSSMWPAPPAAHTQPVEYYSAALAAMVDDWRSSKGIAFPLGTMQLPPSTASKAVDPAVSNPMWAGRPDIREAQAISPAHPDGNTTDASGVAVTIDLGGASNWGDDHPPNKNEMARRLALQLLHTAYKLDQESGLPLWTGPVLSAVELSSSRDRIILNFTEMSSQGGLSLRDVKAPTSVDDGRGGVPQPSNNCTRCCDGGGAPFEVTFDSNPAGARQAGRNLTWVRLHRTDIAVGANSVVLAHGQHGASPTGVRYAWTDFVDCVLDNGNSSGIPASPFRHWFSL